MFATIALFSWPVVVVALFRKTRLPVAVIASLLGGYLLLPTEGGVDLPLLPALEKGSIPALSALAMVLLMRPTRDDSTILPGFLPGGWLPRILLGMIVIGAFLTVLTNGDTLVYGPRVLPALRPYDAFSAVLQSMIVVLPLLLARKFLAHPEQQRLFLVALCVAGLAYSMLALYEVRMSPQLNRMVYGYFPHSWVQHIRGGGWRPLVFLGHGLQLAIFFTATLMAATALWRMEKGDRRAGYLLAALWLFMTLVLCKSLGALIIAMLLTPLLIFFGTRTQLLTAAIVVVLVTSYPLTRGAGLIPVEWVYTTASEYDAQRGSSLKTRLVNEDALLEHAQKRPLFGWGGWGRNRVYDEYGTDISITDGYWVIAIAGGGWVRFLTEFLLLGAPVVLLYLRRKAYEIGPETAAITLIVAASMVDLLPNSALVIPVWMAVGALWGRYELGRITARDRIPAVEAPEPRGLVYTRTTHRLPPRRAPAATSRKSVPLSYTRRAAPPGSGP